MAKTIQNAGWLFSNYLIRQHALAADMDSATKFGSPYEVSVASGASMMVRQELIGEIGLFDDKIPFFYDDTLLSFKVWLAGKRVVTVPTSRIHHIMGATKAWNMESTTFNLFRARICLMFDVYPRFGELAKASLLNIAYTLVILFCLKKASVPGDTREHSGICVVAW